MEEHSHLSDTELRVRALESLLTDKGLVDPAVMDGARVIARAWMDNKFKKWLLHDGTGAINSLGYASTQGADIVVLENTEKVHNMVVCTLCSCYPWAVLGLPPAWYKSFAYRSRAVKDPRSVLAELGQTVPEDVEVRVWDSTAEVRYLVLPQRHPGTEGMAEDELADLVTRNSMIGTEILDRN